MRRRACELFGIALIGLGLAGSAEAASTAAVLRALLEKGEFLAARVIIRRSPDFARRPADWSLVREVLFRQPELGDDLVLGWDRQRPPGGTSAESVARNAALLEGDKTMLAGRFADAFAIFQKIARELKPRIEGPKASRSGADYLYPFVLHGMARALFGMGRFDEALEVYTWFQPTYTRYRQILFERMWAAFRAGRIDHALGAIASQRSAYYSLYLEPEAYLVELYLYKILCRDQELAAVVAEIREYRDRLKSGSYEYQEWARSDGQMRALLHLATAEVREIAPGQAAGARISVQELVSEQTSIRDRLKRLYERERKRLMDQLTVVEAYASITDVPGVSLGLKPVERLGSRQAWLRSGLEIWPAKDSEQWLDEVGRHRFIGDSECGKDQSKKH